jgi:hypothetical protein
MSAPDPGLHFFKEDIDYITRDIVINDETLRDLGNTEVSENINPDDFIFSQVYSFYKELEREENIYNNVKSLTELGIIEYIKFQIFELVINRREYTGKNIAILNNFIHKLSSDLYHLR